MNISSVCSPVISLYELAIHKVAQFCSNYGSNYVNLLSEQVTCDLFHHMYTIKLWPQLNVFMADLPMFLRILVLSKGQRQVLHKIFQKLMDEGYGLDNSLSISYIKMRNTLFDANISAKYNFMANGYHLATFFSQAGWFKSAKEVLSAALSLHSEGDDSTCQLDCQLLRRTPSFLFLPRSEDPHIAMDILIFHLKVKLLNSLTSFSRFVEAKALAIRLENEIFEKNLVDKNSIYDVCQAFNQIAYFYSAQSQPKEAYKYACMAIEHISYSTPQLTLIDVFRIGGLICLGHKDFESAHFLLKHALIICDNLFKLNEDEFTDISRFHPCFGDLLIVWACYYHNIDLPNQSILLYEKALNFRLLYFTGSSSSKCFNLLVALAHQDLAFGYYNQEYCTGRFEESLHHVELAKTALEHILPPNHHLLSVIQRYKALIIEEIAIDEFDENIKSELLNEALKLHLSAIEISKSVLGEENLLTAKHYANLGRLYQTMQKYEESESVQLRSIEIKEKLLGKDEYEVAQSYGYLASLYNYDMELYEKAARYYLKSIDIITKVLGPTYSGLEIEYEGLLRVYTKTSNFEQIEKYHRIIRLWKSKRDALNRANINKDLFLWIKEKDTTNINVKQITKDFFSIRLHRMLEAHSNLNCSVTI